MVKERLDILVQRRAGVALSKAQALVRAGQVFDADGHRLDKPGLALPENTLLDVRETARFVSRGGGKLESAFAQFGLDVAGRVCLDAGASTGGFTDCLLQHGAAKVYAVDVGYGQLAWKLRQDARVVVMERQNIRKLTAADLDERPSFFTADCSFISLEKVLPPVAALLMPEAEGVVLIKPQFEANADQVGKGGVVRDAAVHDAVITSVCDAASRLGFQTRGIELSPFPGPAGNKEFLAHLFRPAKADLV